MIKPFPLYTKATDKCSSSEFRIVELPAD